MMGLPQRCDRSFTYSLGCRVQSRSFGAHHLRLTKLRPLGSSPEQRTALAEDGCQFMGLSMCSACVSHVLLCRCVGSNLRALESMCEHSVFHPRIHMVAELGRSSSPATLQRCTSPRTQRLTTATPRRSLRMLWHHGIGVGQKRRPDLHGSSREL